MPSHEEFPREILERVIRDLTATAGVIRYVALRDGVLAGGASVRMAERVAQLTGAATATAHRRRGVQTALLSARLTDAAEAGCGTDGSDRLEATDPRGGLDQYPAVG